MRRVALGVGLTALLPALWDTAVTAARFLTAWWSCRELNDEWWEAVHLTGNDG